MTVREIAKIAGVSPTAVSIVLNNKKGVSDETRAHIQKVLKEHNYIKEGRAKEDIKTICFLKYKKHGMLVEQNEGFIASIIDAAEAECKLSGYSLNIVVSNNDFHETIEQLKTEGLDGLLVLGTELSEQDMIYLENIKIPLVIVDNAARQFPYNSVSINNEKTVRTALEYVAGLGHKTIAYFKSEVSIANFEERNEAFFRYCKEFDLAFDVVNCFELPPTLTGSYEKLKKLLKNKPSLPTCAFADNDSIAIGAIKALTEMEYKVPGDISVIGFDDIDFSTMTNPPLTTMRIPKKLIGALAINQINDMSKHGSYRDVKVRVGGKLVKRESTK